MSRFRLYNGVEFDLLRPDPALITLDAVAIGLSNICRYSGQLPPGVFYSVAEHSVHVSRLVPRRLALAALLHDAPEGIGMSDVISPLKALISGYDAIEYGVMAAVAKAFGFDHMDVCCEAVKDADRQVFLAEMTRIRGFPSGGPDLRFDCLTPSAARALFIHRYNEIQGVT